MSSLKTVNWGKARNFNMNTILSAFPETFVIFEAK